MGFRSCGIGLSTHKPMHIPRILQDDYGSSRDISQDPLYFRGARLIRFVEAHLLRNFDSKKEGSLLLGEHIRKLRYLPGSYEQMLQQPKSELELCLEKIIPLMGEFAEHSAVAYSTTDHEQFVAIVNELLEGFTKMRDGFTHQKNILREHFFHAVEVVYSGIHTSSIGTHSENRFGSDDEFLEVARLRDALYEEWSAELFQTYLIEIDRFLAHPEYFIWRQWAEKHLIIIDTFPTFEKVQALRDELEIAELWRIHTQ